MISTDQSVIDEQHDNDMDVEPPHEQYERQVSLVARALRLVLDYTFCSFERTLRKVLSLVAAVNSIDTEWYHMGLFQALKPGGDDSYWHNVPQPDIVSAALGSGNAPISMIKDYVVWYCAVWRMQVTRVLERLVQPWHDAESERWFLYRTQLFRDTHLDLLTVMIKNQCYSDMELHQQHVMRTHYPTSNRACCAEELPDLSPYALDNFKTGAHLKERTTLHDKIGHYACIKTFNNICKDRNWWDIIRANGEQHPLVYDHIKLCIKTVLLGNLPGALGSLDLMARVRLNLSFWPEYADQELSEEEVGRMMPDYCNPFVVARQKRVNKLAKEAKKTGITQAKRDQNMAAFDAKEQAKMAYTKTRFKMWLITCRYFASSLMKEFMFYVQESGRCIDEYLSLDLKWIQYKNIIRIANGQCRLELSQQASVLGPSSPFNWRQIEFIEKSQDGRYDLKSGKIMAFHNIALKVARKVMKRNFVGIIKIKATGIEEKIPLDRNVPLPRIFCDPSSPSPESGSSPVTKMTLDELLFMGYCLAVDDAPIPKTAVLQAMGMTRAGLQAVRKWMIDFHKLAIADDAYKKKILKFARRSLSDYLILMTAIEVMNSYLRSEEHVLVLPADWAERQAVALRKRILCVSDWAPTPERLGFHYQCYGCQKFANAVVVPMDYPMRSNYAEYTYARHRIYTALGALQQQLQQQQQGGHGGTIDQNMVLHNEHKRVHVLEYHKDCFARLGLQQQKLPAVTSGNVTTTTTTTTSPEQAKMEEKKKKKKEKEEKKKLKRNDNISFLNIAACGLMDGKPYCVRNKRKRITGPVIVSDDASNVILRSRNNLLTISCNKVATSIESVAPDDGGGGGGGRRHNSDDDDDSGESRDDDDDDDDDTETTRDEEDSSSMAGGRGDTHGVGSGDSNDIGEGGAAQASVVHITRPEYEEDAALLTADIGTLNARELARLHRYAIQHTQDLDRGAVTASASTTGRKPPVENNKKRIRRAVMEPLHRRYSCERPMREIDMVGLVKNGMVLCVECGVMTQYRNYNMTAQGPTCMRHRHHGMQRSHHAWNTGAGISDYAGGGGGGINKKLHRHLIVPPDHRLACHLCVAPTLASLYLIVYDEKFKLQRLACCTQCHTNVKAKCGGGGSSKHHRLQVYSPTDIALYRRLLILA